MSNSLETISTNIEEALVARNLRGMADVRPALQEGYCLRAAQTLFDAKGVVLIGTGFPVTDTFETDGPLGAIALYKTLEKTGSTPYIVCGAPLSQALKNDYRVIDIQLGKHDKQDQEAQAVLDELQPKVVFSIERPGQAEDGHYYNMRGENISARSACFDSFMNQATCPTIAIGDGGNEIGMGNITEALKSLDIVAATTKCDELLVADVSNWGAYGLIAMIGRLANTDLLAEINPLEILRYLSSLGSVDGVTRLNQLTEDGQDVEVGDALILELRRLSGF
ncbi:MAG: glutamate cyclase domain-containing protein [Marinomonas sp.]